MKRIMAVGAVATAALALALPGHAQDGACFATRRFNHAGETGWLVRNECGYTLGVRWCVEGGQSASAIDAASEIPPGRLLRIVVPLPSGHAGSTGISVCGGPFCLPPEPGCRP